MSSDTPSLFPPGHAELRSQRREGQLQRLLERRLPLLAGESLLQRLAGLLLRHPQQAGFVGEMTRRAQCLRLGQDLAVARELEAEYVAFLAARGITESWYDPEVDEAELLDRHYRQLHEALDRGRPAGLLAWLVPRPRPSSR
ncbi:MAG: hypothetical protein V4729_00205 [Pseudomonadota bacterium]